MIRRVLFLLLALSLTACVFKGIDSCIDGDIGNGCTPVHDNLAFAAAKSENRAAGGVSQSEYGEMDKELLKDEYRRIAPQEGVPKMLGSEQAKVRIYPYSDGDKFYDTRDIYIVISRPGFSRSSYVYTPEKVVSLRAEPKVLPSKLYVNAELLNIRAGASSMFDILGTLNRGDEVKPIRYRAGFYEVVYGKRGDKGWVKEEYVQEKYIAPAPMDSSLMPWSGAR